MNTTTLDTNHASIGQRYTLAHARELVAAGDHRTLAIDHSGTIIGTITGSGDLDSNGWLDNDLHDNWAYVDVKDLDGRMTGLFWQGADGPALELTEAEARHCFDDGEETLIDLGPLP